MEAKKKLQFNLYAGVYLIMGLIFLVFFVTEVTGVWVTVPEKEEEEQPEDGEGQIDG